MSRAAARQTPKVISMHFYLNAQRDHSCRKPDMFGDRCRVVDAGRLFFVPGFVSTSRHAAAVDIAEPHIGAAIFTRRDDRRPWRQFRRRGASRRARWSSRNSLQACPAAASAARRASALSVRTESFERQEIAQNRNIGASSNRKSLSTFAELTLTIARIRAFVGTPFMAREKLRAPTPSFVLALY